VWSSPLVAPKSHAQIPCRPRRRNQNIGEALLRNGHASVQAIQHSFYKLAVLVASLFPMLQVKACYQLDLDSVDTIFLVFLNETLYLISITNTVCLGKDESVTPGKAYVLHRLPELMISVKIWFMTWL
jgi:hypothetical protein